jgi:Fe(3+) dicitrate transport protein
MVFPVALGPYGEPELYYTPGIDRMSGVEILKGSGSILLVRKQSEVLLIILLPILLRKVQVLQFNGGQGGLFYREFWLWKYIGNTGFQINFLRRQAENLGPTRFTLNDISTKFRFRASPRSNHGKTWNI